MAPDTSSRRSAELRGRQAEDAVAAWYQAKGFAILARRLKTGAGELDLIVADAATIAFVEVKARPHARSAIESVTLRQQSRLAGAAAVALARNPAWHRDQTRFDVVLVVNGAITPLPDAFRAD